MPQELEGALSGYRILDLADSKGAFCTKVLADLGAEVIKIEKPSGDPGRGVSPFVNDTPHPEKSLYFLYRNTGKLGITLNLETEKGKKVFTELLKTADVLVDNSGPDYLTNLGFGYEALHAIDTGLIVNFITEFGQTGPYRDFKGSNLVDFALSGTLITSGYPGRAPCLMPGSPAYDSASIHASVSIVAALYMRATTGEGQLVDTSVHETSRTGLYPWIIPNYHYAVNPDMPPPTPEVRMGASIYPVYPCKDGFIRVIALTPRQWEALVRVLGGPDVLKMPEWSDFMYRIGNAQDLYFLMQEYTMQSTMLELFEAGSREGVPIAPILKVSDFYDSPHTKAREFFTQVTHPVASAADYPGPPYKWSQAPAMIRRPAPCLGEHNERIYGDELGMTKEELAALKNAGVI